jgi:hypothetical protein
MAKKLKVYSGVFWINGSTQAAGVIAGTQKEAADATGLAVSRIRSHWHVTGNERQTKIALSKPHTLFFTDIKTRHRSDCVYREYKK